MGNKKCPTCGHKFEGSALCICPAAGKCIENGRGMACLHSKAHKFTGEAGCDLTCDTAGTILGTGAVQCTFLREQAKEEAAPSKRKIRA